MNTLSKLTSLLSMVITSATAAAQTPEQTFEWKGLSYQVVSKGAQIVLSPKTATFNFDRTKHFPKPDCTAFEAAIKNTESLFQECITWREMGSENACKLLRSTLSLYREDYEIGLVNPKGDQQWTIDQMQNVTYSESDLKALKSAAAKKLGVMKSRVVVGTNLALLPNSEKILTFRFSPDSISRKIADILHEIVQPPMLTGRDREFSTVGKEVACDLLSGRMSLVIETSTKADLPAQPENQDSLNLLWETYTALTEINSDEPSDYLNQTVAAGAIIASKYFQTLTPETPPATQASELTHTTIEIYRILHEPNSTELLSFKTKEQMIGQLFPNTVDDLKVSFLGTYSKFQNIK